MKRIYQIIFPLLNLFLVRVDLTDIAPLKYEVRLKKLLDGDTAEVVLGQRVLKVRFMAIDAPEKGQPFKKRGGDAGMESLKCAQKVIGKRRLFMLSIHKWDIYRRILGNLDNLNFDLIKNGCALLYPYAVFESKREKTKYVREFDLAKREKRGIWSVGDVWSPTSFRKRVSRRQRRK